MAKNFQKIMKDIKPQIQEAQTSRPKKNKNKTKAHMNYIQASENQRLRDKLERQAEKGDVVYTGVRSRN